MADGRWLAVCARTMCATLGQRLDAGRGLRALAPAYDEFCKTGF
jgi:hypothetical protein